MTQHDPDTDQRQRRDLHRTVPLSQHGCEADRFHRTDRGLYGVDDIEGKTPHCGAVQPNAYELSPNKAMRHPMSGANQDDRRDRKRHGKLWFDVA
jgi:hypothetical protein